MDQILIVLSLLVSLAARAQAIVVLVKEVDVVEQGKAEAGWGHEFMAYQEEVAAHCMDGIVAGEHMDEVVACQLVLD